MNLKTEQRIPPLLFSPVRQRYFASVNFLAALETVRDGCREIVNDRSIPPAIAGDFSRASGEARMLVKKYGSPRPPEANEDEPVKSYD